MNTLIKSPLTEAKQLVQIMKSQDSSAFRLLTAGGAYFDIILIPGRYTYGDKDGMKCYIRQTCQVKHGIRPLTRDGMAPTMYFNPRSLTVILSWDGSLPESISPQYLNQLHWLPTS